MTAHMTTDRTHGPGRSRYPRQAAALPALWCGLAATIVATAIPFVDRFTSHRLAAHIRAGYPHYSEGRIDTAVSAYLVILAVVGGLGVVGWLGTVSVVHAGKGWAPILGTVMFSLAVVVALTGLLTTDTSGELGLPMWLGLTGTAPCLPGLAAVVLLWRGRLQRR